MRTITEWEPYIDTIPLNRHVEVQTVTGIICRAKVQGGHKTRAVRINKGGRSVLASGINCFGPRGDIVAVRWREVGIS